jgi:DNA-binding transcriptional MerR regulator
MENYSIKEITKLTGVNASTLRYYEELGLLENVPRDDNGLRTYTQDHLHRLESILCFKDGAMPLEKMREFYAYEADLEHHADDMLQLVTEQTEALSEKIRKMQAQKRHMEVKVKYFRAVKKAVDEGKPLPLYADYAKEE